MNHPNPMKPEYCQYRESRRFTLVELVVVCAIFSVAISGAFAMFMGGYQMVFKTQSKLEVNAAMRKATNLLVSDGRGASYFILYDRFDGSEDVVPPSTVSQFIDFRDNPGFGRRDPGEYGNCLVFVYNGVNPTPFDPTSTTPIARIIVYTLDTALDPNPAALLKFRRWELVLGPTDPRRTQDVEELIPDVVSGTEPAANLRIAMIPLVRGMFGGNLFYNLDGKSVFVNGHIFQGDRSVDRNVRIDKSATNTYAFTITPRGSA